MVKKYQQLDASSFRLGDNAMLQPWTLQSGRKHAHHQASVRGKVSSQIKMMGMVTYADHGVVFLWWAMDAEAR